MQNMIKKTQQTLIDNLKMLMKLRGWNPRELSEASGVSPRMVAYILTGDRIPSIEIADELARAFGLDGWLLIHPSLPRDIKQSARLRAIIEKWSDMSDADRDLVEQIIIRTTLK